jgi:hypothetical protein
LKIIEFKQNWNKFKRRKTQPIAQNRKFLNSDQIGISLKEQQQAQSITQNRKFLNSNKIGRSLKEQNTINHPKSKILEFKQNWNKFKRTKAQSITQNRKFLNSNKI